MAPDAECSACHHPLDETHEGPCPKCGGTMKTHFLKATIKSTTSVYANLTVWQQYKGYWIENRVWQILNICVICITTLLAVYFGYLGLTVGLTIFISFALALFPYIILSDEKCKKRIISYFDYKIEK